MVVRSTDAYFAYYFLIPSEKGSGTRIIYAFSEKSARKKYQKFFGEPAGLLIKRENW